MDCHNSHIFIGCIVSKCTNKELGVCFGLQANVSHFYIPCFIAYMPLYTMRRKNWHRCVKYFASTTKELDYVLSCGMMLMATAWNQISLMPVKKRQQELLCSRRPTLFLTGQWSAGGFTRCSIFSGHSCSVSVFWCGLHFS